jgi:type IV pilus assembly protein PilA
MTRLIKALNKRRSLLNESDKGFTLIELLVVVIIIGILAAIAIPVYLGIQNNAKNSATQSDVSNLKTAVAAYYSDNNALPATGAITIGTGTGAIDSKYGATQSNNTNAGSLKIYYPTAATTWCVQGTSSTGTVFAATDSSGVAKGSCNTTTGAFVAG